jgi:UDP-2,3-diacylglucosamine hydrolase
MAQDGLSPYKPPEAQKVRIDIQHIALVAGEGHLPLIVAQDAITKGMTVTALCLHPANRYALERLTGRKAYPISPGLLQHNINLATRLGVTDLVFAGKVNKWLLLKNPALDTLALHYLRQLWPRNDDALMLKLIDLLHDHGMTVWPQAMFLDSLRLGPGLLSQHSPSMQQQQDVQFGMRLAGQMGALDIGQTVVVQDGMVLAIEAIEGTDQCLLRSGQWSKKGSGAVVVKRAKPNQDERFDMPTVGLRTLKYMKKAGLTMLATHAGHTLYLDADAMTMFANRHGLILQSVTID